MIVTRTDVSPNIEVASLDYTRSTFENVFGGFYPVPSSNSVGIIRVPTLRTASGQTSSSGTFRVYSDESLTNQVRSANITVNYEAGGRTSTGFSPDPFNISGLSPETQYWITFESASVGRRGFHSRCAFHNNIIIKTIRYEFKIRKRYNRWKWTSKSILSTNNFHCDKHN